MIETLEIVNCFSLINYNVSTLGAISWWITPLSHFIISSYISFKFIM